jgi:hypothetical protein
MTILYQIIQQWVLNNRLWPLMLLALIVLLALALRWIIKSMQTTGRSRAMVAALADSTRSQVITTQPPGRTGFLVALKPAPEPFRHFTISYHATSNFALRHPADRLIFQGKLVTSPRAELLWQRGQIPARALGGRALWARRRLDVTNSEYATRGDNLRGDNVNAIIRVFSDLHTRFGSALEKVTIQAEVETEGEPEVEVVLWGNQLMPEEIPALVAVMRAMGRAALQG